MAGELNTTIKIKKKRWKNPVNLGLILVTLIMLNGMLMLTQLATDTDRGLGYLGIKTMSRDRLYGGVGDGVYTSLGNPGERGESQAFLVIGIPTVKRPTGTIYLFQTLDSLFDGMTEFEILNTLIIVFLADFDSEFRTFIKKEMSDRYPDKIASGYLILVETRRENYPDLEELPSTYGDSQDRIAWRSKQAVDFAFLWSHAHQWGKYYLQLEDDVVSTPGFATSIQTFIGSQKKHWVCLAFSNLGFIGKLYRSEDIQRLGKFVMAFYDQHPVDFLLGYFNIIMHNTQIVYRTPSLFQHIGIESSLKDKVQKLKDKHFENNTKTSGSDNPPAKLFTGIKTFKPYSLHLAYDPAPGYFWGKSPRSGDVIQIVFNASVLLERLAVFTGSEAHKDDYLRSGILEASTNFLRYSEDQSEALCTDYVYLGAFKQGQIDLQDLQKTINLPVRCIKISVLKDQKSWLLVREIAVFIHTPIKNKRQRPIVKNGKQ